MPARLAVGMQYKSIKEAKKIHTTQKKILVGIDFG